jgi:hypothetical protein
MLVFLIKEKKNYLLKFYLISNQMIYLKENMKL